MMQEPGRSDPLFTDPLFSRSNHWDLSTSQLSSEYFDGYGWGQVVPDGFGVAYMVNRRWLNYNVANLREWAKSSELAKHIAQALRDMRRVAEAGQTAAPQQAAKAKL